ncbi:hypothetical protein [Paenibacillus amylolyticus]|uniref:hypothetical protein n=1 Tax=Paenibacillus amylolyticus TaxID=1451 RepID=UPI003397F9F6
MPRRSKAPSDASALQYCHQHEWSAVSSKVTHMHDVAEEAEMPRRSEALAFITGF